LLSSLLMGPFCASATSIRDETPEELLIMATIRLPPDIHERESETDEMTDEELSARIKALKEKSPLPPSPRVSSSIS